MALTDIVEHAGFFALTLQQQQIATDHQLHGGRPIYTTGGLLFIDTAIDPVRFHAAIEALVAETAALRLGLRIINGEWRQAVLPPGPVEVPVIDLRGSDDPEGQARAMAQAAMAGAFDPRTPPLYRFALLRLGPSRSAWLRSFHHLVIDAIGQEHLAARLAALYAGGPARPGPGPAEATLDDEAWRASARFEADRAYWLDRLSPLPEPLVEADRGASARRTRGTAARLCRPLDARVMSGLYQGAAALRATPLRVLLTLTAIAFARLYDRDELLLGVMADNRTGARFRDAIGLFARPLPFRFLANRGATLAAAVQATGRALAADYRHRRYPVQTLGGRLHARHAPFAALWDVVLNYLPQRYDMLFDDAGCHAETASHGFGPPVLVTVIDRGPDREGNLSLDYDDGLIDPALAASAMEALCCLLAAVPTALDRPPGTLPIMTAASRAALLSGAPGPVLALPDALTLPALIAAQALLTPSVIAVQDAGEALDYRGLLARADELAAVLAGASVGRGQVVAVAVPRGVAMVVALLAVQRCGAAFLPLDAASPRERTAFMLRDAAAVLVVAGFDIDVDIPVLRLDRPLPAASSVPEPPRPDDMAYVLYTSGSTGQPKAVAVRQRNIANLALWGAAMLGPDDCAGMLFSTALVFDVAMFELFSPLVSGGRVLVVENLPALAASPLRGQVRTVSSSPTVLETVLRSLGLPGSVHCVVAAGEALSRDLADRLFAARPGLRLVNAYGPTEATVYASFAEIRPHDRQPPPIGRAIANMELHVLDREARLLSAGAVGELCLGGAGVAAGYLNRPELTAERFIANPFGPGRLYRSGDRAKRLPDGQVVFLGRIDGQLKLHAMRIEAGEVEAALRAQSGVAAAAVGLHRTGAEMRLVAWVVPETPASTAAALRRGLAGRLPRSMVPASFVFLPALPLTPGGKLDRAALPEPSAADRGPAPQRAPATRAQQVIFDLWRKVLEIPAVRAGAFGIDDELVDLGGDSLTAVVICAEIEAACGKPVPGEVLADGITVARLAAWLEAPDQATGLHLLVDGRRIAPEILGEREFVFHLSLPAEEVRLVSHAAVPRRLGTAEDDRLLGVWLEEIVWEQGEKRQFLPLAVPFLGEGFHPTEVGGQRWTNGDAWLAGDLIPQWQGAVVLRLRAWVWQPNLPATPPSRRDTGLAEFESLGDNCEFGFVQQYFDIRLPPGLLRWAATDHRRLLSGLTNSFAALTLPNLIRVLPGDPDYRLATPYFNLHSFQPTDAGAVMQHDAMHRRGVAVLGFLRRKLLRDIAEARKIFVFKTDAADFDEPAMRGLHAALRRHGSAALLCVTPAAAGAPAGEVTRLDEGLYAAQVTRFVLAEGPYDEWLAICERTLHLHRRDR